MIFVAFESDSSLLLHRFMYMLPQQKNLLRIREKMKCLKVFFAAYPSGILRPFFFGFPPLLERIYTSYFSTALFTQHLMNLSDCLVAENEIHEVIVVIRNFLERCSSSFFLSEC